MNRIFFVLIFPLAIVLMLQGELIAQEKSKKELRKERNNAESEAKKAAILNAINQRNFNFIAREIVSSGKARFSNIKLNAAWNVMVLPETFTCNLPIYGTATPISNPSIQSQLHIFSSEFEITSENKRNRIDVNIKVKDNSYSRMYYFNFMITPNGRMSTLTITSDFSGPVVFRGDFMP